MDFKISDLEHFSASRKQPIGVLKAPLANPMVCASSSVLKPDDVYHNDYYKTTEGPKESAVGYFKILCILFVLISAFSRCKVLSSTPNVHLSSRSFSNGQHKVVLIAILYFQLKTNN